MKILPWRMMLLSPENDESSLENDDFCDSCVAPTPIVRTPAIPQHDFQPENDGFCIKNDGFCV